MSDIIKLLPYVNSETNDKAMRAILDGVDYLITKEIKDAPFDKVYTGVIKTVNDDNTYDLTIGGNLYKGVPSMFKASFVENDTVKVVSPQNQMSNIFIFGKMNMEVSASEVTNVAWDVISDKPSELVQDAQYVHTDNNYTTLEKEKLNTIEEGAQKNTITGIKGDAETSYRQGDVNITKANIGLDKVDNTPDAEKTVENATKLGNQAPDYYATAQSVADENKRAIIAEQENSALISGEINRAKTAENDLSAKLTTETDRAQKAEQSNKSAIEVLNGEATVEGSVAYKIAQIVNENDNGSIDTLKEIASWINNNPNSATAMQKQITENKSAIDTHIKNTDNPHNVTKTQIGLSNVDNTSDADKPISTATQKALDLKTNLGDFNAHIQNTENPHKVTASQVGLGNVPNVNTNDQTPTYTVADKISNLTSGEKLSVAFGKIAKAISDLISHIANTSNPHKVTKSQVGLGNVSNYDQSKAIKSITRNGTTFTATALDGTTSTFTQQDNNTTYNEATTSNAGLMSASDKSKLNGIAAGAQVNTVTGVKGDSESKYRTGNINITKANIGLGNVDNTADVNKNVLTATELLSADVRNDNQAPSWYMTNKNKGIVVEFKFTSKIGVNSIITGTFCSLITITPWHDNTGGRPVQIAISDTGVRAQRVATSDTAWGSWVTLPNTDTNTWRGITDSYSGTDSGISLSQKGGNALYNALVNGYASSAGSADTVDGFHEYSFLRYRDNTFTNGAETLWNQIGIREYDGALPSGLSGLYNWGAVVSLPSNNVRFDLYYNHQASSNGNGLYYRTGWGTDKKRWVHLIDSQSIGSQSVNYANSAGNVTGTVAVSHGGTGATSASDARKNLGIGTLGTKNEIGKGDLALKIVNGNIIQLVNASGTVISEVTYAPKIEWNQNTFTSYVWNE